MGKHCPPKWQVDEHHLQIQLGASQSLRVFAVFLSNHVLFFPPVIQFLFSKSVKNLLDVTWECSEN